MMLTSGRVLKFAILNFWRNIWLSLVTVSIISLSFLSINFFVLLNSLSDSAMSAIENKVNISIQFKDTAQEEPILALKKRLEMMPEVGSVEYVSKSLALERMKDKYEKAGNTVIADSIKELDTNPLFASLVVKAKSVEDYPKILAQLDTGEYDTIIEKQSYDSREMLIAKLTTVKNRVGQIGLIIGLFFTVIAALIIFNTIRITIYTRREEIAIMKLVGASNWFVRVPLLIEGVLYSMVALVLTILIVYPILGAIQPYTDKIFDGQALDVLAYFSNNFALIFGYQLLAAVFLSLASSSVAMARYLKV